MRAAGRRRHELVLSPADLELAPETIHPPDRGRTLAVDVVRPFL